MMDAALFAELQVIAKMVTPAARVVAAGASLPFTSDPYIAFAQNDAEHHRHMTGGAGMAMVRYDVDIFSRRRSTVRALADAVRTTLDNRTGTIGAPDAELDVHAVFLDSETFLYEPDRAGSALGWHRAALGLIVWVSETVTPSP